MKRIVLFVVLLNAWLVSAFAESLEEKLKQHNQFKSAGNWQEFSEFEFSSSPPDSEKKDLFRFETSHNELLVILEKADGEKVHQFMVPGAVYMSRNLPEKFARRMDTLEYFGLQSQLLLFLLETAFPDGPEAVEKFESKKIIEDSSDHEIRFLAGIMRLRPSWQAEVSVDRLNKNKVKFDIVFSNLETPDKKSSSSGVWSNINKDWVLADSVSLDGWIVNYHGVRAQSPEGEFSFKATLGDTSSFSTVGDIRKAKRTLKKGLGDP